MKTPIVDFIKNYNKSNPVRVHMPAHKGKVNGFDVTEIQGADSLFDATSIIKESEENLASLYNSLFSVYSTEGCSLCIKTAVALIDKYAKSLGKKTLIWAFRNAHRSFVDALALCNVEVKWLFDKNSVLSCQISPSQIDEMLNSADELPTAIYLTSPDYLGNQAPIKEIGNVCKKHNVLLVVDNAHGAYLNFLSQNQHPLYLGADICCDSAHKTLCALTGGAYLHVNKNFDFFNIQTVKNTMKIFASTSPSYLILYSLDKTNKFLFDNKNAINTCAEKVEKLKKNLTEFGYSFVGDEKLKLTIDCKKYGYTGTEIAQILQKENIYVEYFDSDYLVFMFSPFNKQRDYKKITKILSKIKRKTQIEPITFEFPEPIRKMSVREAYFSNNQLVDLDLCQDKILSSAVISCPPAIPILVGGEVISKDAIKILKHYNVKKCYIVKE